MSHDQRPAKVRVVAAGPRAGEAASEGAAGEIALADADDVAAGAAQTAASQSGTGTGIGLMPAALFLLGCIGGGTAVAFLLRGLGAP